MSYTYLMTDGRNYKIGYTDRTPQQRAMELMANSSTYYTITVDAYTEVLRGRELERMLHNKYSNKRIHSSREWFSLNDDDVATIHNIFEEKAIGESHAPKSNAGKKLAEKKKKAKLKAENDRRIAEAKKVEVERYRQLAVHGIFSRNKKIATYIGWLILVLSVGYTAYIYYDKPEFFVGLLLAVFFSLILHLVVRVVLNVVSIYRNYQIFEPDTSKFIWAVLVFIFWFGVFVLLAFIKSQ